MSVYDLFSGFVMVFGGGVAFLAARGRIDLHHGNVEKAKKWRQQYGGFLTLAGPAVVFFGLLHFAGLM